MNGEEWKRWEYKRKEKQKENRYDKKHGRRKEKQMGKEQWKKGNVLVVEVLGISPVIAEVQKKRN